jgi:hypothetical protein
MYIYKYSFTFVHTYLHIMLELTGDFELSVIEKFFFSLFLCRRNIAVFQSKIPTYICTYTYTYIYIRIYIYIYKYMYIYV